MSLSLDIQQRQDSLPATHYDVVVMGAGPYGLGVSAHLLGQGLKVATFGKPIYFWRHHMPQGMLLRSYWWATNLSDPRGKYGFKQYFREKGLSSSDPLPIETFIDYGLWFQQHAVPNVDETYITNIEKDNGRYIVTLEDDRIVYCKAVVMAPGLHYYIHRPVEYSHLPDSLVSHSADHYDLGQFSGKHVAVIGGGQGSLETAALLNEGGAQVDVVTRHAIRWIRRTNTNVPAILRELRSPKAGMGSGWLNLLLEKYPYIFQRLPRDTKDYVLGTRHGPAGSAWLKPRIINQLGLHERVSVEKIEEAQGRVHLTLSNGNVLDVDHVMLGTGYRADVTRLPMLAPSLVADIRTYAGSPALNPHFESSVRGLYFVGFSAARSFGPFYRFVVGNDAAARRVASAIARQVAHAR